jgi:hypothetical protein
MHLEALFEREQGVAGLRSVPELCNLAATGLRNMYDREKGLFCDIYSRTKSGMERQSISPRYTMMTLLGLRRYERAGGQSPVAVEPVLRTLLSDTSWIASAGDLGLLLWTCAEILPETVPETFRLVRASEALSRFSDARQGFTMETAWYLTGLVACYQAGFTNLPGFPEQIVAARNILVRNCGDAGIYGHRSADGRLAGYARRRIGSFADQVYPTIAFSRLSQALHDREARDMAVRTAVTMCDLQGSMGEWSWHYDAETGKVVNRYPVYSVHQHGMGPMMLFAVSEAVKRNFDETVCKSLAWISGDNELQRDFVEPGLGLVWRSIYLSAMDKYTDAALRISGLRREAADVRIKIRYECRPYELGWLLYAFAGK